MVTRRERERAGERRGGGEQDGEGLTEARARTTERKDGHGRGADEGWRGLREAVEKGKGLGPWVQLGQQNQLVFSQFLDEHNAAF